MQIIRNELKINNSLNTFRKQKEKVNNGAAYTAVFKTVAGQASFAGAQYLYIILSRWKDRNRYVPK